MNRHTLIEAHLEAHLEAHKSWKCQAPSSINQILSTTHRCCRSSPLNGLTMRFRSSHNLVTMPAFASIRLNVCRLPPWRSRKRRSQLEAKHVNTQLRSWCPVHRGPWFYVQLESIFQNLTLRMCLFNAKGWHRRVRARVNTGNKAQNIDR